MVRDHLCKIRHFLITVFTLSVLSQCTLHAIDFAAQLDASRDYTLTMSHTFQKVMTQKYLTMLENIDGYFAQECDNNISCTREIHKSRMQFVFSADDQGRFNIHLRGKVILPRLQKRTEVTFSQRDNEAIDNQRAASGYDDVIKDKKLRVGLKYYFYRERRSNAYAKLNLKIAAPFGPYLKLGIYKSYLHSDFLETTLNHALYYYPNGNDLAASTQIAFYKPLTLDYWIGQGNRLFWEGGDKLYLRNNLILYQIFDLNNRIAYRIDFTTSYTPDNRFRQENCSLSSAAFHRFDKWFFIEVVPKIDKCRSNHYKTALHFTLNLGVLLGR